MSNNDSKKDDAHEIARSLEMAIAQIDLSMQESDQSIQDLIHAMTAVTGSLTSIRKNLDTSDEDKYNSDLINRIQSDCDHADRYMNKAVIVFQFYDRLSQRIGHIQENLNSVAAIMLRPEQQHTQLWDQLQEKMRSVYSIKQEQIMYNTLLKELSDDSTLHTAVEEHQPSQSPQGSVELF